MAHKLPLSCWAVWVDNDHIHTQADGKLAIFTSQVHADAFVSMQGGMFGNRLSVRTMRLKTRAVRTKPAAGR